MKRAKQHAREKVLSRKRILMVNIHFDTILRIEFSKSQIFPKKSWQRCECSLCSASKPFRQWKEPRSVIYFLRLKLGIEQMNKVPGKIKISYLLVEISERPLNIPKRPSIKNIGILYNYGPGVRNTNAQRLPSSIWEHSHLRHDFGRDGRLRSSWSYVNLVCFLI